MGAYDADEEPTTYFTSGESKTPTEWTRTINYLGDEFNYTVGTLDIILGLMALTMNALVIAFYLPSYKKVVPFMYLLMAGCDSVTGIGAILTGTIFFMLKPNFEAALRLLRLAYFIYSITFKVSVFLNLSIAIVRTVNILLPFYRMRIVGLGVATAVYTAGWAAFSIWQLLGWKHDKSNLGIYFYQPGQFQGVAPTRGTIDPKVECRNSILFIGLPYVLPSVMVVGCMAVQIKTILKQRPDRNTNTQTQREITITIFLLTIVFFFCNTVYLSFPIYTCLKATGVIDSKVIVGNASLNRLEYMIYHILGVLCPFINAAVNPVILISRGQALSGFLRRKLTRLTSTAHHNVTNISLVSFRNPNFRKTDTRPLSAKSFSNMPLNTPGTGPGSTTPTTEL